MNLAALFIKRPVTTTLIMLGIIVFGTMAYRQLPVSDLPTVDFPTIQVSAGLPGASPETMASAVALPLEKQFATIAGLNSINSTSSQGSTNITLQFDLSRNIDAAAQDVQSMIAKTARQLPPQMPTPPSYQKVNPGDQPVLFLVLRSATLPMSTVDEYAETTIAQRISMVSGVAQVQRVRRREVRGAHRRSIPRKLAAHGIGIDEVATAISNSERQPADRHDLRPGQDLHRAGQRPAAARRGVRPADHRLPQRQPGPARRGRPRLRRHRERQERRAGTAASARSIWPSRSSRAPTSSQVVDAVKALLPTFREQLPAGGHARRPHRPLGGHPRVGPRREVHAAADDRAGRRASSSSSCATSRRRSSPAWRCRRRSSRRSR